MLKHVTISILALIFFLSPASSLSQETEEILLTIQIQTDGNSKNRTIDFTRADLMDFPDTTVTTTTIWTDGEQTFTGVQIQALLQHLNIQSAQLELVAENEYSIEVPAADFYEDTAVLAYARNGEVMTLRENGPLWLVYDYDSDAKYRTEFYYLRSIWQLTKIMVKPY
ncbi:molybdopterin-dependent oxidoreductase [Roseovarius sp. EL26]|uniref:molybdopterin-dependent oxidoreductase n=1 Tax=Roseovarius sp. EL26 TaxID=2126672 RepID=UPI000EA397C0|nr:molybdopterin-dependent oxidoreductase [Roseovarius sp. EL26]